MKREELKDWTDEDLIEEAKGLHDCIDVAECFSATDVMLREWVEDELVQRGYTITSELKIYK